MVGKDQGLLGPGSNGVSSGVEGEPLSDVIWVVVLDSKSQLISTNGFTVVKGSVSCHSRLDLEFESVLQWEWWELDGLSIDPPGLIEAVVATPPDGVPLVNISSSMDIEALSSIVSYISELSNPE